VPRSLLALLGAAAAIVAAIWLLSRSATTQPPDPADKCRIPNPVQVAPLDVARADEGDAEVGSRSPGNERDEPIAPPKFVRGFVEDERGQPVRGAVVRCADGGRTRTDAAGGFVLEQRDRRIAEARLLVTAAGRSPARTRAAWGTAGHRLTLSVAGLVAVQVVDAASREPIEGFTVQLVGAADPSLRADPVQIHGPHPGALAEARVAIEDPALLRVVADDDRYAPSPLQLVRIDATRPQVVRCELRPWRELAVAVVDVEGTPVTSAEVEVLALPPGLACSADTLAVTDWRQLAADRASSMFVARTGANGERLVRVPAGDPFVVRVSHPEHGGAIATEADVDADGERLRLVIAR
jgi:hypothetical protein